jgi:hypothetical protein
MPVTLTLQDESWNLVFGRPQALSAARASILTTCQVWRHYLPSHG